MSANERFLLDHARSSMIDRPVEDEISQRSLDEVALTRAEYSLLVQKLGRRPNQVELGMFGAMWSEHCGYKNSKPLLRRFPTRGPRVLLGAGAENAGAVDIGDGLAVVMKIESHNHPSAIEPYQGAATGVGGIVRDIFTMGARPVAILDSLRFGPPTTARNRYLLHGVVAGIAGYGNCLGLPTVGGEVYFDEAYSGNPLVNAMCVGIVPVDKIVPARASGVGNPVLLVGADTGRDGIHGATFASVELNAASEERRPAVQVGNPFTEKLLIEACLELRDSGWIVGMQDLGAAGLTSSSVETAHKGHCGIELDVLHVSRRESGMTPYEIMLSESQERMLVVVKRGCERQVQEVFRRWGLHSDIIGQVIEERVIRVKEGAQTVAEIPTTLLTDEVPLYTRAGVPSPEMEQRWAYDYRQLSLPDDLNAALLTLLASPDLCNRQDIYQQYDHMVGANTLIPPGSDAAVLRVRDEAGHLTGKAIALTTDGNGRLCYLDPFNGGALAVAEAARNLVCTGAAPLAPAFQREGNLAVLLGDWEPAPADLGGSTYLKVIEGQVAGRPPQLDLRREAAVQRLCLEAFRAGLLRSAHDCSDGGLAVALAECAIWGNLGLVVEPAFIPAGNAGAGNDSSVSLKTIAFCFGEAPSRIIVSLQPKAWPDLAALADQADVPIKRLGTVGGTSLRIGAAIDLPVAALARAWRQGLSERSEERRVGKE